MQDRKTGRARVVDRVGRSWDVVLLALAVSVGVMATVAVLGGVFTDGDAPRQSADASSGGRGSGAHEGTDEPPRSVDAPGGTGRRADVASPAPAGAAQPDEPVLNPEIVAPDELPLTAEVSNTLGLADGDPVTIRVSAHPGSQIFALEARLCAGDVTIRTDPDIRPSRTGKCVPYPLSPVSDAVVDFRNAPPYEVAEATFRVGVGTTSYITQEGEPVTITCNRDHPCTLAVKYQVPNGYGFRAYPLEYR